jgi:hypothetical protein
MGRSHAGKMKAMNSATTERPQPAPRSAYMSFGPSAPAGWTPMPTVKSNNVVYYSWFDTAVNALLSRGVRHSPGRDDWSQDRDPMQLFFTAAFRKRWRLAFG